MRLMLLKGGGGEGFAGKLTGLNVKIFSYGCKNPTLSETDILLLRQTWLFALRD